MPGRRPIHDDDVPFTAALELLDLAEHDDVMDAWSGGRHDVDHPGSREPLGDAPEPVIAEVLLQGLGGGDLLARELAEQLRQHRLAVELDGEHALTGIRGRPGQDRRYRGLADPSLPRHDRHSGGGQQRYWIDGFRRHLCAD